ncbi:MAG: DNA gyrase subunit A [Clostridia bacterium]
MKKDNNEVLAKLFENTKVQKHEICDELKKSFIAYAMAVNASRAIPDVRDGLKPVHRRILFSMNESNNTSDKPYKKCAKTVGDVLGKYHPHGDSSVYDALVRLAQDFSIRYPLIDGHGNFGSIDGDSPAAYRYTESRLAKISSEMLRDIEKETVDYYPNFDDTLMQPVVLPSRFPNLLVNGADGIAVGMATNIPPHNLCEVISGVEAMIENPDIDIEDLIKIIPAPDYPTGGIIMGRTAVKHAYRTGRGGIVVRGRAEIEEHDNGRNRIVITELPYQVNKARLIVQIAELVKNKRLEGISDIKEESDRDGMRIVIDVKKDANAQVVLNSLYKHTQLQVGSGIILLALVNGEPKILNLKQILFYYLEHQKEVIVRRTRFDLTKAADRAHIVDGLVIALSNIDEIIRIIKTADDKQGAIVSLIERFAFSDKQANAILDMKLSRLTGLEAGKLKEELAELTKTIAYLQDILDNPQRVLEVIKTELEEIKTNFGDARRTEISLDMGGIDIADLIEKEDVVISMTHGGYIKRMSLTEYKTQKRGGVGTFAHKTKEEDFVENMFVTSSHDDLLFFTNLGKVYCIKSYEVPESQKQAKGRAIINLLQLSENEKVTALIQREEDAKGVLVMATKQGLIKRTNLAEFESIRKVGKIAIKLVEGDELIGVGISEGGRDILIATNFGKCIRFSEDDVREMGRDTQGVKSIELAKDDRVVDMAIIKEDSQIITVSELGFGKRSSEKDYRCQIRGGKGVKAGVFNDKTGRLVNLKQAMEEQDAMLIADNGIVMRTPVQDISLIGRDTQGVRIMKLKDDAKIVCVSLAEKEEETLDLPDEVLSEEENEETEILENSFSESEAESSLDEIEEPEDLI